SAPGSPSGAESGLLRAQLGPPLAVEVALALLAVGRGELFECLLRIIGQFGLGLGGLGGLTRGGRALAPGCLVLRLFGGGDGGLMVRVLRKQRRRSPADAHAVDDNDHGEESDPSPAPLRCSGWLPVTGRTLRVGLGLRMRLLRRLALCVGLPVLRVGRPGRLAVLLARWVRRLAWLLRLPWLLAPTGIRLRPGLRGPLAAGLVV